jgi:hypothetical protein
MFHHIKCDFDLHYGIWCLLCPQAVISGEIYFIVFMRSITSCFSFTKWNLIHGQSFYKIYEKKWPIKTDSCWPFEVFPCSFLFLLPSFCFFYLHSTQSSSKESNVKHLNQTLFDWEQNCANWMIFISLPSQDYNFILHNGRNEESQNWCLCQIFSSNLPNRKNRALMI